ncbi:hypothetical protein A8F94_09210 [Bacillus sp. FJAT-27225]|uniref:spore germination protein n=1 Tax=Bacillus sp. FJAT-27225 TaxID=1743144 RepID=UPI00080C2509|nr:spore germination protein [Bacillus sp. FJAT-27225]OCA87996.1 hypothetical protein A8F94_09210 [Bacillus sp. FJAT-27225]
MKNNIIVHRMKTNIISTNGNINLGSTLQNSHTSNIKATGASWSFGDQSNVYELNEHNKSIDVSKSQQSEAQ